nr:MAG TPA: hypothetical protein [Caudoviricetes sp.]
MSTRDFYLQKKIPSVKFPRGWMRERKRHGVTFLAPVAPRRGGRLGSYRREFGALQ